MKPYNQSSQRVGLRWSANLAPFDARTIRIWLACAMMVLAIRAAVPPVTAQEFRTLHGFTDASVYPGTNTDGAGPMAELIISTNILYGTANRGGAFGNGTIFAVNTNGTGFTNLHSFTALSNVSYGTNSDGRYPEAGLVLSGNTLYGTASSGGSSGYYGTVYKLNINGSAFSTLHHFTFPVGPNGLYGTNSDGALPYSTLILSGSTLYGTAFGGGAYGQGTVFAVNTAGTPFSTLHSFSGSYPIYGNYPAAGLVLAGSVLYGTTEWENGSSGPGSVFAVTTSGGGFSNLYHFAFSDGDYITAGLTLSGNTLYGTTMNGGAYSLGTIFKINTDGTGFTNLYHFGAANPNPSNVYDNADGFFPHGGLVLSSNTLYGTAASGGAHGNGTIFAIHTDGSGFSVLHAFSSFSTNYPSTNSDGGYPVAKLLLVGNTLYGTASEGGPFGYGTIFSLSLAASPLKILPANQIEITAPSSSVNLQAVLTTNTFPPTFQWCQTSGEGQVLFSDATSSNTEAFFSFAGVYNVSVTARDGTNRYQASATVTVHPATNAVFTNIDTFLANTDPARQPNKFLTYGYSPTNNETAASNYYAAIDPNNLKTTFSDWKKANGFPPDEIPAYTTNFMGNNVGATYFNAGDLGFGRRMIMGGTNKYPAFAVSNFTNVDDAISGNGLIATVAMDYSPGTNGTTYTKFYVFDSKGTRVTAADLDGGGKKAVPGLCIVCHGGQNVQPGAPYSDGGNIHAHFLPFDLKSFDYSCDPNFTQAAQEPAFKLLNQGVLGIEQSYAPTDVSRRPAIIELIQGWYGTNSGTNLPRLTQDSDFVPDGWKTASNPLSPPKQAYLYLNVVAPSCRTCHMTRAEGIDFNTIAEFDGFRTLTSADVFGTDPGTLAAAAHINPSDSAAIRMPQARRTFQRFWTSLEPRPQPETLRDYLTGALANYSTPPSIATAHPVDNGLLISFTTSNGGSYRIEQADDLAAPLWTPSTVNFAGTGGTNQVLQPIDPNRPHRFFRVRSLP